MANRAGKGVKSLFTIKLLYNVNDYASFLVHVCCARLSCGGIEKQGKSGYGFLCKHSFPCGQRKIQYLFCQHMTKKEVTTYVVTSFFGFRQEIKMLGRSEFALRQGFAAQNACTAQKRRFFGSSGQRVEQGASEALPPSAPFCRDSKNADCTVPPLRAMIKPL